ncbi:hypothetical protein [Paenibacillus sp. FSL H7-0714]|uniref:hypothetical protein n=1 Tax=Paenibacillus sp. FSL H7-0714 TaxID=2954735 RepID=UPI0030F99A37
MDAMSSYLYGDIIPGLSVGDFKIGCSMEEVLNKVSFEYHVEFGVHEGRAHIIEGDCIKFFFDFETKNLVQITVFSDYKGKFQNLIGIGTVLSELKDVVIYEVDEEDMDCSIEFPGYNGIRINTEKWDDDTPIKFISVYESKGMR